MIKIGHVSPRTGPIAPFGEADPYILDQVQKLLEKGISNGGRTYPVQIVWGADDPALRLEVHGEQARRAAGLEEIHTVPAKHFLQEDQAPAIAERVAGLARDG